MGSASVFFCYFEISSWNLCIPSVQQNSFLSEWIGGICWVLVLDSCPLEQLALISTFTIKVGWDPVNGMDRKENPLISTDADPLRKEDWNTWSGICKASSLPLPPWQQLQRSASCASCWWLLWTLSLPRNGKWDSKEMIMLFTFVVKSLPRGSTAHFAF